jgi:gliding motility-associated lipoprotein GldD
MQGIKKIIFMTMALLFMVAACKQNKQTPKPRGHVRIDFPEKSFLEYSQDHPFRFEIPGYSEISSDTSPFAEAHWLNIEIEKHKAKIHLSYKPVKNNLYKLTEDSRELVYKHSLKASAINEQLFINQTDKVFGTIYEIKGNAASPMQFHLTDSAKHFMRGSLYIGEIPNYDSLLPVIEFIQSDIYHLIETFNWE